MVARRPDPSRRNPLLDVMGPPSPQVDVDALYRQFERQDRMLLAERARAGQLTEAVTTLRTAMGDVVTELDATRVQVTATNAAAGGRIAAVATRCRDLLAAMEELGIEPVSPAGVRASSGQLR